MKMFWTLILILLVAVQSFGKCLILLHYQVNQNYIAQNLCENRAKPESKCQGKCQLNKKLAADEQAHKQNSTTAKVKFAEVLFDALPAPIADNQPASNPQPQNGFYQFPAYFAPHSAPFHPPAAV